MKRGLPFLLLCLSLSPAAQVRADTQLDALYQAARAGDATARYDLGVLYEFGRGPRDRLVSALAWYQLAAELGNAAAAARRDALRATLPAGDVEAASRLANELRAGTPAANTNPPP